MREATRERKRRKEWRRATRRLDGNQRTYWKRLSPRNLAKTRVARTGGRKSENPRNVGSKALPLILNQSISVFHTGRTANIV